MSLVVISIRVGSISARFSVKFVVSCLLAKVLTQRSNLTPQWAKNIVNQRANITQWSNYLPRQADILSQQSQRVNSTGKEHCESTGQI